MTPLVIGIAGGSGSGKTTLADRVAGRFGDRIALLRHDDYYKPTRHLSVEERAALNYDHPSAFDTALLVRHLDALRQGEAVDTPLYDYATHDRKAQTRRVEPKAVVVVEGILILEDPDLRERFDLKVYVDTDADVRILRRIRRDVEERGRSLDSVIRQYLTTVKPMHEAFVAPSRRHADVIIPEGGNNPAAYGMLFDRISAFLDNQKQEN